jgi:nicotinamidase-related amidase
MDRFFLDKDDAVLLIVDIQDRLAAAMKMRDPVVSNTLHLIELSRMMQIPVILTEQYPKGIGPTVPEIRDVLTAYEPIEKLTFSCCDIPPFIGKLRETKRQTTILTGMETHICVLQTCLGLLREGFYVHSVADAQCSRTKENWKVGLEFMRDAGAVITSTETVLFQLLKVAGTEEFKAISKRIK